LICILGIHGLTPEAKGVPPLPGLTVRSQPFPSAKRRLSCEASGAPWPTRKPRRVLTPGTSAQGRDPGLRPVARGVPPLPGLRKRTRPHASCKERVPAYRSDTEDKPCQTCSIVMPHSRAGRALVANTVSSSCWPVVRENAERAPLCLTGCNLLGQHISTSKTPSLLPPRFRPYA